MNRSMDALVPIRRDSGRRVLRARRDAFGRRVSPRRRTIPSHTLAVALILIFSAAASAQPEGAAQDDTLRLSIKEAIELGLKRNLDLRARQANVDASNWSKRSSYLRFLPTGNLTSRMTTIDDNTFERANQAIVGLQALFDAIGDFTGQPIDAELQPFLYKDTYETLFHINQEFPLNYHLIAGAKLARTAERLAQQGYLAERDLFIYELRRAYFQLVQARELVEVATESVSSAENQQLLARERQELGMISRAETLRWEVALSNARSQLVAAQMASELNEMALNQLLYQGLRTSLVLEPVDSTVVSWGLMLTEMGPDRLADRAVELSYTATALRANNDLANANRHLAMSGLIPSIHFQVDYGWQANATLDLDEYTVWTATAMLSVPIFDLGYRSTDYKAAAAQKRMNDYETENSLEQLRQAVRSSWQEVIRFRENLSNRGIQAAQAKENFDVMADQYNLGRATEFDFVNVQVAYINAMALEVVARYEYYTSLAALESLLGSENWKIDMGTDTEEEQ